MHQGVKREMRLSRCVFVPPHIILNCFFFFFQLIYEPPGLTAVERRGSGRGLGGPAGMCRSAESLHTRFILLLLLLLAFFCTTMHINELATSRRWRYGGHGGCEQWEDAERAAVVVVWMETPCI